MMKALTFLAFLASTLASPLSQDSLITARMPVGSPLTASNYMPVVLEEWQPCKSVPCSAPVSYVQQWALPTSSDPITNSPACTNLQGDGQLDLGVPDLMNVWYICRNVATDKNITYRPAPVVISRITEEGNWQPFEIFNAYPPSTTLSQVIGKINQTTAPYNSFYMIGGALGRFGQNYFETKEDASITNYTNIPGNSFKMVLLNDELNILNQPPANGGGATGQVQTTLMYTPSGPVNTGWRITSAITFPESMTIAWFTTDYPKPALVRLDLVSGTNETFKLPPTTSMGGTSGPATPWLLHAGQFRADTSFHVFVGNGTSILSTSLQELRMNVNASYKTVLTAPAGWKYTSLYARRNAIPFVSPSPSPSSTASPTPSSSISASISISNTPTPTPTSSPSPSLSGSPSVSHTPTPTPSPSATPSVSYSATNSPTPSTSVAPSPSVTSSATPSSTSTGPYTPTPTSTVQQQNNTDYGAIAPQAEADAVTELNTGHYVAIALVGVGVIATIVTVSRSQRIKAAWVSNFGIRSPRGPPPGTLRKRTVMSADAVIEINHNPQLIMTASEQRMEHLRRQYAGTSNAAYKKQTVRVKKQFTPMNTELNA